MPAQKQIQRLTVTIPADASGYGNLQLSLSGDFVYVESVTIPSGTTGLLGATTNNFALTLMPDSGPAVTITEAGKVMRFPQAFEFLRLRALTPGATAIPLVVTLVAGFGAFADINPQSETRIFAANGTVTRPANVTAYTGTQIVGPQPDGGALGVRFSNVWRLGSSYSKLTRARIIKSTTNTTNANFRLHLFSPIANPPGGADQSATIITYAQAAQRLGVLNFPSFITGGAGSDAAFCDQDGLSMLLYVPPGGYTDLWGILECLAAYTPGSGETFRIDLYGEQL